MTSALEFPPPRDRAEFKRRLREERTDRRRAKRNRFYSSCYTGMLRVVQFPAYAMDLLDRHGKPDHSKMGPFLVSQELVALCAYDVIVNKNPLQTAIVLTIAVLSFASASLMRKFLDKSNVAVTASSAVSASMERKEEYRESREYLEQHFTVDGIPARSNPAREGATTAAGDS